MESRSVRFTMIFLQFSTLRMHWHITLVMDQCDKCEYKWLHGQGGELGVVVKWWMSHGSGLN